MCVCGLGTGKDFVFPRLIVGFGDLYGSLSLGTEYLMGLVVGDILYGQGGKAVLWTCNQAAIAEYLYAV